MSTTTSEFEKRMSNNGTSHSNVSTQKKLSVEEQKVGSFLSVAAFYQFIVHFRAKSK